MAEYFVGASRVVFTSLQGVVDFVKTEDSASQIADWCDYRLNCADLRGIVIDRCNQRIDRPVHLCCTRLCVWLKLSDFRLVDRSSHQGTCCQTGREGARRNHFFIILLMRLPSWVVNSSSVNRDSKLDSSRTWALHLTPMNKRLLIATAS